MIKKRKRKDKLGPMLSKSKITKKKKILRSARALSAHNTWALTRKKRFKWKDTKIYA